MNNTTYSTGTVTVGAASTTLTGTGTAWLSSGVRAGDVLVLAGLMVVIASVTSNTAITLRRAWPGAAQTGANYDILLLDDEVRSLTAANALLQALGSGTLTSLGQIAGTANQLPYWTGVGVMGVTPFTAAARALLDDADAAGMRTTLGLVPQANPTDTSAGRLLPVGAFGLGQRISYNADLNAIAVAGIYGLGDAVTNGPTGVTAGSIDGSDLHHYVYNGNNQSQVLYVRGATGGQAVWTRRMISGTWGAWRRLYDQRNVVGTVSQSAGVPTGALVERGSNANGEYIRFADGTQICWCLAGTTQTTTEATGSGFRSTAGNNFIWPAAFTAPPVATPIGHYAGGPAGWAVLTAVPSATTASARYYSFANNAEGRCGLVATGRWF